MTYIFNNSVHVILDFKKMKNKKSVLGGKKIRLGERVNQTVTL